MIKDLIEEHLQSVTVNHNVAAWRRSYQEHDYVEFHDFMPKPVWRKALGELEDLFEHQARRRDLVIPQSGNTPRKFSNLDRDALAAGSTVIPQVFGSPGLNDLLQQVIGERVLPVPYVPEQFIASRLHQAGDVHGWHWDDYSFALVWIFKMPGEDNGGSLEYIKRVPWDRDDPKVDQLVARGPVMRRHPKPGSAYLLKADTALHRVRPLNEDAERMMVCFTFASESDLDRNVDHASMEALFSPGALRHD